MFLRPALRRRLPVRVFTGFAFLALGSLPAVAQPRTAEDRKVFAEYRLTMPAIRTVMGVMVGVASDPESKKWANAMQGLRLGDLSIAELSVRYDGIPPMKRAIANSKLSTRAFVTALFSFLQAAELVGVQDMEKASGGSASTMPPSYLPKANVELIRQNKAEIDRLNERLKAAMKAR